MPGSIEDAVSAPQAGRAPLPRHVIAVASGKGGVGKSTVAVNLAAALAQAGARCGLLDADFYGPSVPLMTGLRDGRLRTGADRRIQPLEIHGLKIVSVGFMVPEGEALMWRGAILHKLIHDFIHDVDWGECDYLIVDLPPGTGDVPLSLHQAIPFRGALLVTTPQPVALADATRAAALCNELNIPLLGLIENMSGLVCPHCQGHVDLFTPGGAQDLSGRLGIPLLGRIPFDPQAGMCGDLGLPPVLARPDSPMAATFREIAERLMRQLAAGETAPAGVSA